MTRHLFALPLLLLALHITCAAADFERLANLRYREDAFYENADDNAKRCVLDITYPKGQPGFRTIVWFHGGGLTGGNKHTPEELKAATSTSPNAVIAVGYRLAGKGTAMAADSIDDAAAAVAWILKNIEKYGGDPKKVFLTGHSAGGYLTMMVGMKPALLEKYGCAYTQLAGLAPLSGQCLTHFRVRAERNISNRQPIIDEFAPLYFTTTPTLPPILLVTGDREKEMLGRMEENALLYRMLKISGHKDVIHYEMQGYGHNMTRPGLPLVVDFVNRIAPPPKPAAAK